MKAPLGDVILRALDVRIDAAVARIVRLIQLSLSKPLGSEVIDNMMHREDAPIKASLIICPISTFQISLKDVKCA